MPGVENTASRVQTHRPTVEDHLHPPLLWRAGEIPFLGVAFTTQGVLYRAPAAFVC